MGHTLKFEIFRNFEILNGSSCYFKQVLNGVQWRGKETEGMGSERNFDAKISIGFPGGVVEVIQKPKEGLNPKVVKEKYTKNS